MSLAVRHRIAWTLLLPTSVLVTNDAIHHLLDAPVFNTNAAELPTYILALVCHRTWDAAARAVIINEGK